MSTLDWKRIKQVTAIAALVATIVGAALGLVNIVKEATDYLVKIFASPPPKVLLNTEIVLDISEGMRETFDGVQKWKAARQAVEENLQKFVSTHDNLALRIFGGSCAKNNTKLVVKFGQNNHKKVRKQLRRTRLRGQARLSTALKEAIGDFNDVKRFGGVIKKVIVVAGSKRCPSDDLAAVRLLLTSLQEAGEQIEFHVWPIGMGLSPQEEKELTAIATESRGQAFFPKSLPEFEHAFQYALQATPRWRNSIGMEFVRIEAGTFTMRGISGLSHDFDVTISQPFYMGKYEVTQEQWKKVMSGNPSRFKGARRPVDSVSWEDAQAFIAKLNEQEPGKGYRLPTGAEWEYACRAGTEGRRSYEDIKAMAWYMGNSGGETHEVGQKRPNAWGLHDMLGNAYEWVHATPGDYTGDPIFDPENPKSILPRVLSGGTYGFNLPSTSCTARSGEMAIEFSDSHTALGFRVVLSRLPNSGL